MQANRNEGTGTSGGAAPGNGNAGVAWTGAMRGTWAKIRARDQTTLFTPRFRRSWTFPRRAFLPVRVPTLECRTTDETGSNPEETYL